MKIRDRVCLKSAPAVYGTVIALRDGRAKIYWPSHVTEWIDEKALICAPRGASK